MTKKAGRCWIQQLCHDAGQKNGRCAYGAGEGEQHPATVAMVACVFTDQQTIAPDDETDAHQEMQKDSQPELAEGEFRKAIHAD